MRKIVIANQKGGVGKTTTAVNLAAGLVYSGKRTLAIDMDPQANLTFATLGPADPTATIYDLLVNHSSIPEVKLAVEHMGLDLIPSNIDLAAAEVDLIATMGRHKLLSTRLTADPLNYDFVIIDAPPSLGLLTINALVAATEIIIPVSTSIFALRGISRLQSTIDMVKQRLNRADLSIAGILCTMYDHTNVAIDVHKLIRHHFGELTFKTVIPKNVKLEEAHSRAESVFGYAPHSKGAEAYARLVQEVLDRG